MSTLEYRLDVPGLRALVEEKPGAQAAQALLEPFTALGEGLLDLLLPEGRRAEPTLEVEDDLLAPGWPKGWSATRTVIRYAEDGTHRAAKLSIHYAHISPADLDGWHVELKVPGAPLWVAEDAVLEVHAQANDDFLTVVACHLPADWPPRIQALVGEVFPGEPVFLSMLQDCAWRVPPDQPTFLYPLWLPGPLVGDHSEAFVALRPQLLQLAEAILDAIGAPSSPAADYALTEDGGLSKATASVGQAPRIEIELDHLQLSGVDFLSFTLRLAHTPADWSQRGSLEVAFNSDRPDQLTLLEAVSLPDAWLEPLLAAIEATFQTSCEWGEVQPLLFSGRQQ